MSLLETASLFADLGSSIYMNTAATGVGPKPAVDALQAAAAAWAAGRFDYMEAERAGERARQLFAEMINVSADCVALIPTASAVAG